MKKNIIITGGNEGLGKTLTDELSKENNVIILATNKETILNTISSTKCDGILCDIRNFHNVEQAIKKIIEKYGQIDILINNAGLYIKDELIENDYSHIKDVIDVNLLGTIYCTKAVLPYMINEKRGLIININSQLGTAYKAERSIYSVSKWGVTGLSKNMQCEVCKYNIRTTNLQLGSLEETMKINGTKQKRALKYINNKDVVNTIQFIINTPEHIYIPDITVKSMQENN